jgi:hypothetical protein
VHRRNRTPAARLSWLRPLAWLGLAAQVFAPHKGHRVHRKPRNRLTDVLSFRDQETLAFWARLRAQRDAAAAVTGCFTTLRRLAATGPAGSRAALALSYDLNDLIGAAFFTAQARAEGRWVG